MPKATINFYKCEQISQSIGGQVEHMIGRVYFWFDFNGGTYDLVSNLRLAYGGNYMQDPIEADRPGYYHGPFNYEAFRQAAENYFRKLVGPNAVISFAGNIQDVEMKNITFEKIHREEFEIDENSPAW